MFFYEFDEILKEQGEFPYYGRRMAPKDLATICYITKLYSIQTQCSINAVWEYLVHSGEHYWMPSVYAITDQRGRIKIGQSGEPEKRLIALQVCHPERLSLLGSVPCLPFMEGAIHRYLWRQNISGEWFKKHKKVSKVVDFIVNKDARALYKLLGVQYYETEVKK